MLLVAIMVYGFCESIVFIQQLRMQVLRQLKSPLEINSHASQLPLYWADRARQLTWDCEWRTTAMHLPVFDTMKESSEQLTSAF